MAIVIWSCCDDVDEDLGCDVGMGYCVDGEREMLRDPEDDRCGERLRELEEPDGENRILGGLWRLNLVAFNSMGVASVVKDHGGGKGALRFVVLCAVCHSRACTIAASNVAGLATFTWSRK